MKNVGIVRLCLILLGVYQIAAGGLLLYALIGQTLTYILLLPLCCSFLQIIAGLFLFPKIIKPQYIYLTYVAQAIQTMALKFSYFGYMIQSGIIMSIGVRYINGPNLFLRYFLFWSQVDLGFTNPKGFLLAVNIAPLLLILGFSRLKKKFSF